MVGKMSKLENSNPDFKEQRLAKKNRIFLSKHKQFGNTLTVQEKEKVKFWLHSVIY